MTVELRPPGPEDAARLVAGRDEEFHRWLGAGAAVPAPVACIWVDGKLAGWVDYDREHDWLAPDQVNVGYYLFPAARGKGYAARAVELLLEQLEPGVVATLLIDPANERSLALARRLGFAEAGEVDGQLFFTRR